MLDKDLDLKEKLTRLFDRTTYEAMALLLAQPESEAATPEPLLEWMTASQLARYWQLVSAKGEPTIMKWTKRSEGEHPLPYSCMGDLLRFRRDEVDRWAAEEASRRRVEQQKKTSARELRECELVRARTPAIPVKRSALVQGCISSNRDTDQAPR